MPVFDFEFLSLIKHDLWNEKKENSTYPLANKPLDGLNVLSVDDHASNQQVTKGILQKLGANCVTVNSGKKAIQLYISDSAQFDLLLMDCEMPELDGFLATEKIRAFESDKGLPRTHIIALTAHVLEDQRHMCEASGMDDFLSKPVNIEKLMALLSTSTPGHASSH